MECSEVKWSGVRWSGVESLSLGEELIHRHHLSSVTYHS